MTRVRTTVATLTVSVMMLMGAISAPAMAQQQAGLVNVAVGDVTVLENVGVGVAAQVAAQICGVQVGQVGVLAAQAIRNQTQETVCTIEQDGQEVPVTIG